MQAWWIENVLENYVCSNFLSRCIQAVAISSALVTLLSFAFALLPIQEQKRQNGGKSLRWTIAAVTLAVCAVASVNLFTDAFSKPDIDGLDDNIYFGQSSNNLAEGRGRLFDRDKNILYRGEFKQGQYDGYGVLYGTYRDADVTKTYVIYDGYWKDGKFQGSGRYYSLCNGEPVLTYEGDYLASQRNGFGTEYSYSRKDSGEHELYCSETYTGAYAYHEKCGYGVKILYDASGNPTLRYRGTWWKDAYHGKGILECMDAGKGNYGKVLYHGQFRDNEPYLEGVWYRIGEQTPIEQGMIDEDGTFDGTDMQEKYPYPDKNDSLWW